GPPDFSHPRGTCPTRPRMELLEPAGWPAGDRLAQVRASALPDRARGLQAPGRRGPNTAPVKGGPMDTTGLAVMLVVIGLAVLGWLFFRRPGVGLWTLDPALRPTQSLKPPGAALSIAGWAVALAGLALIFYAAAAAGGPMCATGIAVELIGI